MFCRNIYPKHKFMLCIEDGRLFRCDFISCSCFFLSIFLSVLFFQLLITLFPFLLINSNHLYVINSFRQCQRFWLHFMMIIIWWWRWWIFFSLLRYIYFFFVYFLSALALSHSLKLLLLLHYNIIFLSCQHVLWVYFFMSLALIISFCLWMLAYSS